MRLITQCSVLVLFLFISLSCQKEFSSLKNKSNISSVENDPKLLETTLTQCPVQPLTEMGDSILKNSAEKENLLIMGGIKTFLPNTKDKKPYIVSPGQNPPYEITNLMSDLHEFISPSEAVGIVEELKGVTAYYDFKKFPGENKVFTPKTHKEFNLIKNINDNSDWMVHSCRSLPPFNDYKTYNIVSGPTKSISKEKLRKCYRWLFNHWDNKKDALLNNLAWARTSRFILIKFGIMKFKGNWHQSVELRPFQHRQAVVQLDWPVFIMKKPLAHNVILQTRQIIGVPEIRQTSLTIDNEVLANFKNERERIKSDLGFIREAPKVLKTYKEKYGPDLTAVIIL